MYVLYVIELGIQPFVWLSSKTFSIYLIESPGFTWRPHKYFVSHSVWLTPQILWSLENMAISFCNQSKAILYQGMLVLAIFIGSNH
jgi:hypothetical protein